MVEITLNKWQIVKRNDRQTDTELVSVWMDPFDRLDGLDWIEICMYEWMYLINDRQML